MQAWWFLGEWASDRELTMRHFNFRSSSRTPELEERIGRHYGHLRYRITRRHFQLRLERRWMAPERYRVAGQTSSSVTLALSSGRDLTLNKRAADSLFIRSGPMMSEYFRHIQDSPAA